MVTMAQSAAKKTLLSCIFTPTSNIHFRPHPPSTDEDRPMPNLKQHNWIYFDTLLILRWLFRRSLQKSYTVITDNNKICSFKKISGRRLCLFKSNKIQTQRRRTLWWRLQKKKNRHGFFWCFFFLLSCPIFLMGNSYKQKGPVRHKQVCTRVDLEGQKKCPSPCPARGSNPGSSDLNSDALTTGLLPRG